MMNKEEEQAICQKCAKCCLNYWIFTNVPEEVERFKTLSEDYIEVIKIKKNLWKILFKLPCKYLVQHEDKWHCRIYNLPRPKYCPQYPRNFINESKEVLRFEKEFCPLLDKLHNSNER